MTAGFGTISNACNTPVTVIGARSPGFGDASLHQSEIVDGISRMRPVDRLTVPPGGSVELEPGGLHLMLMQPAVPLSEGATVDIELALEDGSTINGQLRVRKARP